ncbi:MAG: AMP-binding protein [Holophaga sp.]|jgi:long-chain-fatty-acid--[acyl-carrier-protein] ligase
MGVTASLLMALGRGLVRLRYRIRSRGIERVAARGRKGILFLPNHPALIDPVIVISELYGRFAPASLADKDRITMPVLGWLTRKFGALPMPDLARYGESGRQEVERAIQDCAGLLNRGGNLVLYPGGHLMTSRQEELGGNSAVETILRLAPETRVVLVRTRGLWGSRFSRAQGHPDFLKVLLAELRDLAANFIFFSPRRPVTVELAEPEDLPRQAGREVLNRRLEAYYNEDAPPALHVPHTLWETGGTRPLPDPPRVRLEGDLAEVPGHTREQVLAQLERMLGRGGFPDAAELARDLGMDSLMRLELQVWIEQEFGHPVGDPDTLQTVGDVLLAACGKAVDPGGAPLSPVPSRWFGASGRPVLVPAGRTVPEVFLAQAARHPDRAAVADQAGGVRTYRDLVTAVFALLPIIRRIEGPYVGIMLPASGGAAALFLAVSCAGKVPVMVNWSTGMKNMVHGLDLLGVKTVLTVSKVVARLQAQGLDLAPLEDRLLPLERAAAGLTRAAKLKAWLRARISWRELRRPVPETAVVLFTSGSETLPKAVPLTHANILANIRDVAGEYGLWPEDCLLGMLPPFHSFGLTCTMLLPLCAGIKAVYYPVPTDGGVLARHVEAYGVTLLVGTPTFLGGIVRAAREPELKTLRYVITGAEKCPDALFAAIATRWPGMRILEGYGITECSPVVSGNREDDIVRGSIGRPMPSLASAVVDLEGDRRAEPGEIGMLLVRGPSVFGGYLGFEGPQPFVAFEGETWYRTGDLVREDGRGNLVFAGRLKRFVKMGGEMVSLPAVEEVLLARFGLPEDEEPPLAVEALETDGRADLVLFAARPITREDANAAIREAGLSPIHNIRLVRELERIPLLGTGKTDYRALKGVLDPSNIAG